jgi:hypothetical protein
MMARPGLDRHVKFRRLLRLLDEPIPHVRGYLECLWEVAYENGDPLIGDADAVEAAAHFPGEHGKLFVALRDCGGPNRAGFIEPTGNDGEYQVHDLFDHAPAYVSNRKSKETERKRVRHCDHCGEEFRSTERHARFCSTSCRVAHHRETNGNADVTEGCVTVTRHNAPPAPAPAHNEKSAHERFTPPTVEQVRDYVATRKVRIDPEQFVDYYITRGWRLKSGPMRCWKAAVRTWEKNERGNQQHGNHRHQPGPGQHYDANHELGPV